MLLGGVKLKAQWAALASLGVALIVAFLVYDMPVDQGLLSASEGAIFGLFPIMWIVVTAIWVYNMTVETGHFAVLRRSFGAISDDQRVQAVIIAFCFGALLEALAGFGTPVAITAVMLIAWASRRSRRPRWRWWQTPRRSPSAPIAIPITTLSEVTDLPVDDLGGMVGRQTPLLAVIVPLILIGMVDGMRGIRQTWPVAVVGGGGVRGGAVRLFQLHLGRADRHRGLPAGHRAIVGFCACGARPSRSSPSPTAPARRRWRARSRTDPAFEREVERRDDTKKDPPIEVFKAYAPYLIIIVVFAIAQLGPIKDALAKEPFTYEFEWPGLDIVNGDGEPLTSLTFNFNWLPAAGTLMLISGFLTMLVLRVNAKALADGGRQDVRSAQVGDPDRGGGPGAGLRDEPVGPDHHHRPLGGRGGEHLRLDLLLHRLAGQWLSPARTPPERALRRAPGGGREGGRVSARSCWPRPTAPVACWAR